MLAVLAAVNDTPYNIVLILHILAALVAFAPAFVNPLLTNQTRDMEPSARQRILGHMAGNSRRVYAPALIVLGFLGFALSGMSDGANSLSETWLIISIVIWIVMNGVLHAVLTPAERALASGDETASKRVDLGGGIMTILLLVVLGLMVFQPT